MSDHKIRTALTSLINKKLIIKGNYNKIGYDKTNWYAITNKGLGLIKKCPTEPSKMSNGKCKNVQPIPVNIPVNKKDYEDEFNEFWERYPNRFNRELTYKNFVKTAKRYGADTVLRALDIYLDYIKRKGITEDYITRSANFVGAKAQYRAYLEMAETQSASENKPALHHESSDELFRRLAEEGGFEDDRKHTDDTV